MAAEPEHPVPAPEVVVSDVPKQPVVEKEAPVPAPEAEKPETAEAAVEEVVAEEQKITKDASFKEETNVVSELPEAQRKALEDLKKLVQEAVNKHEFTPAPPPPPPVKEQEKKEEPAVAEKAEVKEEEKKEETSAAAEAPAKAEVEKKEPAETPAAEKKEVPVKEETPAGKEVPVKEEKPSETPAAKEDPAKAEVEKKEVPVKEEKPAGTPAPAVTETVVVEKIAAVRSAEEGEKTVEEIKETIVEVAAPPPPAPQPPVAEDPPKETDTTTPPAPPPEEISIWGIPLLADDRTDVILLKFLRARDFNVKDAFAMLKKTIQWRKQFGVDELLDEDLGGADYEKAVFASGVDKEGRRVCYNVFGEFQNKELYQNTFADGEKRKKFLRWLIQFLEKLIRTLDFSPRGINSFVLVNDLKNSPGYDKRDLYKVINKFLQLLQDNYPEFVAKQLCINVSWWYLAYNWVYLTVFTPRSKSKFVFAGPSKTAETLFNYIAPEQVPVQFGGHSKDGEHEFCPADPVTEVTIKPGGKHAIEFSFSEPCAVVWELRVIGWDVNYGAEFTPVKEGGYTLNITKTKKVTRNDEPIIGNTFKVTEPGKVILSIDNQTSKKKKLLYRSKVKSSE